MIPIYRVLREGDPERLKNLEVRIMSDDVSLYGTDTYGNTVLHYAALFGRNDVLRTILSNLPYPERKVNNTNSLGETPFHYAALGGDPTTVSILLDYEAYPEALTEKGETIVHYAAVGRFDTLAHILARLPFLNLNIKDAKGFLPLDYALRFCRLENALLLLLAGSRCTERSDVKWVEEDLMRFFPSRGLSYEELELSLPVVLIRNPDVLLTPGENPLRAGLKVSLKRLSQREIRSLVSALKIGTEDVKEKGIEAFLALIEDLPDEVVGDLKVALRVLLREEVNLPERVSLPEWVVRMLLNSAKGGDKRALVLLSRAKMDENLLRAITHNLPFFADMDVDDEVLGRILSRLDPESVVSVLRRTGGPKAMCRVVMLYGPKRIVPHLDGDLALSLLKACGEKVRNLIVSSIPSGELSKRVEELLRDERYDALWLVLPNLSDAAITKVIQRAPKLFYEALGEGKIRPTFRLLRRVIKLAHKAGPMDPTWIGPLEALLEADPSLIVQTDGWGNSLLHHAAFYPHLGVVKTLIRKGAGVFLNVPNRAGYTPLSLALHSGGQEVAEYLRSLGAKP